MRRMLLAALSIVSGIALAFPSGNETPPVPSFRLTVRIEPASGTIDGKAEILNPQDSSFILNKDMVIHRIVADGTQVPYHLNTRFVAPNFMPNTVEVVPEAGVAKDLLVEYGGPIRPESYPPMVNVANMVNAGLVEVAVYVAWYPKLTHAATFTYRLEADLPSKFVTVVNGAPGDETREKGRSLTRWTSYGPVGDIALVAAPGLHRTASTSKGSTVEIYYDKVPESYVDSMKTNLLRSMGELTSLLSALQGEYPSASSIHRGRPGAMCEYR